MLAEDDMALDEAERTDLMAPELYARARPLGVLSALRDRHGVFWHDMPPGNSYGHRGYWSVLKYDDLVAV
jgi:hypothetical protein